MQDATVSDERYELNRSQRRAAGQIAYEVFTQTAFEDEEKRLRCLSDLEPATRFRWNAGVYAAIESLASTQELEHTQILLERSRNDVEVLGKRIGEMQIEASENKRVLIALRKGNDQLRADVAALQRERA